MSAIAGLFQRDGAPADPAHLDAMMYALAHRGPDGQGTWCDGAVALGHQTQWVTPESRTERPPVQRGLLTVTARVRLDDRETLFDALRIPPSQRSGMADSLLILRAYEQWGVACTEHLTGNYTFALWDGRARQLLCAVDPLGHWPLHYHHRPGRFAFASEAKALLTLPGVEKRLNEHRLAETLVYAGGLRSLDKTATFFQGIDLVPPAHRLLVRPDDLRLEQYWDPARLEPPCYDTADAYVEAFRTLFADAVRDRLRTAYPTAILLSGGLDSSAIACVAARERAPNAPPLFAVSSVLPQTGAGSGRDERPYIEAVTRWAGIDVHYVVPSHGLYDSLEEEFFRMERPFGPRRDVYRGLYATAHAHGARVVLDGRGGELGPTAHGRDYLLRLLLQGAWTRLVQTMRSDKRHTRAAWPGYLYRNLVAPLLRHYRAYDFEAEASLSAISPDLAARTCLAARARALADEQRALLARRSPRPMREHRIVLVQKAMHELEGTCGLRSWFPFYDPRLLAFSLGVPESLALHDGYRRGLIRAAMDGRWPPALARRTDKKPFSPDYFERLAAGRDEIRAALAAIGPGDPVHAYLDVDGMRSTLARLEAAPSWHPKDQPQVGNPAQRLDFAVMVLRFLRWFDAFQPPRRPQEALSPPAPPSVPSPGNPCVSSETG